MPLSADPLLVWNYGSMAVISGIAGCIFWLQYRKLDAQEDELNALPTGHVGNAKAAADIERRLSSAAMGNSERNGSVPVLQEKS